MHPSQIILALLASGVGCASASLTGRATREWADVIYRNGSVYTVNQDFTKTSAVAVKDGRILAAGSDKCLKKFAGNETKIVDLYGHMVMPGFVDAHMHALSGGQFLLKCNLEYQSLGIEEILGHIQGCIEAEEGAEDDWMEVVNMDYPALVQRSGAVTKADLDSLDTDRPIIIRSSDYHTVFASSRALELSNITDDTPNPSNGIIERLPGSREPSGILQDDAYGLLAGPPPLSDEENVEAARAALKLLREAGITTFQDAAASEEHHMVFSAVKNAEDCPLACTVMEALSAMNDPSQITPQPTLKWQAVKGFIDGVITYPALTAAVVEPYWLPTTNDSETWAPDEDTLVEPYWSEEILTEALERFFLEGIDVQLHTDGDLAVQIALNAAEKFQNKYPDHDFRLGLAHDELTQETDWPRFAKLGVDAIMSFQWAQLSSFYIPDTFQSLGEYRHDKLQAHWQIEGAGRPVVYGSDWPIDPLDEFLALKVGVTRRGDPENPNSPAFQGAPFDGIFPGEGLTREQVIRAITINGARFLRADHEIGSIEKGKMADMIILEHDFFEVANEELGRNRVLATIVGGEVVYAAEDAADYGFDLEAKFPNDDVASQKLARRSVGGFAGKGLSSTGRAAAAKLRKRGECPHKH